MFDAAMAAIKARDRPGRRWHRGLGPVSLLGAGLVAAGCLAGAAHPATSTPQATSRTATSRTGTGSVSSALLHVAVVGGRFVIPVTIGGLTVDPAPSGSPSAPLGLDLAQARAYAGFTSGLGTVTAVGYGLVTLYGVPAPGGAPPLTGTPAWVGVALGVNEGAYSCPAQTVAPRRPSGDGSAAPFVPEDRVVVFFRTKGRGAILYDTGGTRPCSATVGAPSLAAADATVPVPWRQRGPAGLTTTVTYRAPRCATTGQSIGGNAHTGVYTVTVLVTFPFARSACGTDETFTTTVSVYPADAGPGAPPPPGAVTLVPSAAPDAVPPALVGPVNG